MILKYGCKECTGFITAEIPVTLNLKNYFELIRDWNNRKADFDSQGKCPHYGDGISDVDQFESAGGNAVAPIEIPVSYKKLPIIDLVTG
ncbi:MAG: hypothetical protein JW754_03810 [Candidatus Aenigmarchaeota archaeon]|nr:hypothetical protein [Candidatus Aenigmarchaeota archaeon]